MDSEASLIPLAEYDLAKCYEKLGNHVKAEALFQQSKELWRHADPELQAAINSGNLGSEQRMR